jgi:GNAT superfamily N-acetyltransferase
VDVRVERVGSDVGLPLRHRVLRPQQALEELRSPDDDDPDTGNYVAMVGDEVVSTASVRREPPPWPTGPGLAWRLRGMATADGWRSSGIGAQVLEAVVQHVRDRGGGLLWCNARVPAVGFYLRAGFRTRGEEWVEPMIGPHIAMELEVDALPVAEV